ncbi:hypothetical protein I551_1918 [Mycobacterium ulcerans str. Harvey]|uniref:Uncharacterized protein n=1 Tax=Mycobacterium ulcerans str. Harvey TaxID=1299332 RepID=A0ABP3ANZ3_MYCUL|nr:hypothetical protein I551_1918 [Mycobacterium ulcerans str. Harvey]
MSVSTVTPDTFVVDIAPEIAVIVGVGDGDLLDGLLHRSSIQVQFCDIGVE